MDSFIIMVVKSHVLFMFSKCTDCQVLSTCSLPIYNLQCDINCTTPDQNKIISFYRLPDEANPFGQCSGTTCQIGSHVSNTEYSIQSTDSTTTTLRINNLSWDDKGTWRCDYDLTSNTTVLGFAKYPDDIEYPGFSNNSEITSGTKLSLTMKCLHTENSTLVTLIYMSNGGTVRSTPVSCTDTASSCANTNFVSKSCTPIIQVGNGVVCDGNYSIEIATSVLNNDERTYSALTGITIKCTGSGGGSRSGALIAGIIVAVIVIIVIIIIIIIICCLLNKRCRSRYLRKDSKFLFTWPRKDIVVIDIDHDKDFKIVRPTGEKIEIQCVRTEKGWYVLDGEVLYDGNGVRVTNNPCIFFNPYFEICCLKMEHEGLYIYKREDSFKNDCILTMEICKDIIISSKPLVYWAHEGEWLKLQLVETSFVERWIKKNSKNGKETIIPNPPKKSSLVLQNINNEDAGSYIAANTSETWKSGCLTLKIVNSLVTVGKKDGSHVTIIKNSIKLKFTECKLSSIKLLKWRTSLLTDGTKISELESTSNYELILSEITKGHEGRYWCEVTNKNGTSTKSGILTLQVVHAIVNVGMKSASCSATIGDSIQIRFTEENIPQQIIFKATSGTNQIAPEPKITKITDTASFLIEKISQGDEGCYQFASADGDAISGVLTLSVMEENERNNSVYIGRSGARKTLESIPDKKKRKKKKKKNINEIEDEEEVELE